MEKHFVFTENDKTIFQASNEIDAIETDNYEKDGLIFTPSNTGVGNSKEPFKTKFTWKESFKWKPPQHNTIGKSGWLPLVVGDSQCCRHC